MSMNEHKITDSLFSEFAHKLQEDERSSGTIQNYLRHIKAFHTWAGEIAVTKELVTVWKDQLKVCHDVAKLADVLGHSSIETTRIYLISTGTEHAQTMARLGLVE